MSLDARDVVALVEAEDPDLRPEEKETTVRFAKDEDRASVFTSEAGLARRVLAHPHVDVDGVTIVDGDARPERALKELEGDEAVVGVRATIPVGALQVKSSPRSSDQHAAIVSDRVLGEVKA